MLSELDRRFGLENISRTLNELGIYSDARHLTGPEAYWLSTWRGSLDDFRNRVLASRSKDEGSGSTASDPSGGSPESSDGGVEFATAAGGKREANRPLIRSRSLRRRKRWLTTWRSRRRPPGLTRCWQSLSGAKNCAATARVPKMRARWKRATASRAGQRAGSILSFPIGRGMPDRGPQIRHPHRQPRTRRPVPARQRLCVTSMDIPQAGRRFWKNHGPRFVTFCIPSGGPCQNCRLSPPHGFATRKTVLSTRMMPPTNCPR